MRRSSFVDNFILSWKALLGFGAVIAFVGGIEWAVHAVIVSNTVIARDAACTVKGYDGSTSNVVMKLDCGGSEDVTKDPAFIAAFVRKPGPFTCTRYGWAYATCKMQEAEK